MGRGTLRGDGGDGGGDVHDVHDFGDFVLVGDVRATPRGRPRGEDDSFPVPPARVRVVGGGRRGRARPRRDFRRRFPSGGARTDAR